MISQILIVEDDSRTRKTIERFCREVPEAAAARFVQAANGIEAMTYLKTEKPDLMFLDMEMPGMGGRELLQQLMAAKCHIQVVVVSGYDGFEYTKKAIQYGSLDYLLKPVNRKQVHEILLRISQSLERGQNSGIEEDETGIHAIRAYLDECYTQPITLKLLSEQFHYSREYISREFKKQYGIGIVRYLNDLRLERARVLLRQGLPVQRACEQVGFSDDSYFTRLFKDKYGVTPKKYHQY